MTAFASCCLEGPKAKNKQNKEKKNHQKKKEKGNKKKKKLD